MEAFAIDLCRRLSVNVIASDSLTFVSEQADNSRFLPRRKFFVTFRRAVSVVESKQFSVSAKWATFPRSDLIRSWLWADELLPRHSKWTIRVWRVHRVAENYPKRGKRRHERPSYTNMHTTCSFIPRFYDVIFCLCLLIYKLLDSNNGRTQ